MKSSRKSLEGIRSNYSHIDSQLSAAISIAESMGIDTHGNFNGMHRKRKIPKRIYENRDNAAPLTMLEKLSSTRKKYFSSLI